VLVLPDDFFAAIITLSTTQNVGLHPT